MPTLRTGFGPHGVQDPPCIERLRVGFFEGATVGLATGLVFFTFSEIFAKETVLKPSLTRQAEPLHLARRIRRIGSRTVGLSLFFGTFMLFGSAIKCT